MADPVRRGGRVPREVEEAEAQQVAEQERRRLEQLNADLRVLMVQPAFQRYAQHLMAKCGTFGLSETLQAGVDFRNQARRGVGVEICAEWGQADRATAAQMMAEMLYTTLEPKE